jgi:hypothetical protein
MRNVKIFFILILLLSSGMANAQSFSLSGRVVDSLTNEAIPFANILYFGDTLETGTSSDINGNFKLVLKHDTGTLIVTSAFRPKRSLQVKGYKEQILVKLKPCDAPPCIMMILFTIMIVIN